MQDLKILIREAGQNDSKDIFEWRNDLESRSMFINSDLVTFDEHDRWFSEAIRSPFKYIYIGEIGGKKIGITRFDFDKKEHQTEVSININPNFRGKGYGKKLLIESINKFQVENETTLVARIKKKNIGSRKIFEYVGFVSLNINKNIISFKKPLSKISFKKVDVNDSKILFDLLKKRVHLISHNLIPTYANHKKFVESDPYQHWHLIYQDDEPIGYFYIQSDNSIGLNLISFNLRNVKQTLKYIKNNFKHASEVASKIPPYFYINAAYSNTDLIKVLTKLECAPIQTSYKLY
ncbi:GNAT family N-acetyltransferase [Gammaproteobacteria bacterium]|nr:GNAT family N-acetyltransferase [Gammaproteobacteria bacterium]